MLHSQLAEALEFASKIHQGKNWKDTSRPFIYHPMAVASLVLFYGGDEVQAQAAILHDTIVEGSHNLDEIEKQFGPDVANLVRAFEDPPEAFQVNLSWADKKKAYLTKIEKLSPYALLLIACEELHELATLNQDIKYLGAQSWKRYPVPGRDIGWYYKTLATILYHRLNEERYRPLISEFASETKRLTHQVFEGI